MTMLDRRTTAARRLVDDAAAARIDLAPAGYLLAHDAGDVARHCALLSPVPDAGEVRVVVTPGRSAGRWHLDVGARDRPGLLAACTGALAALEVDVAQAVLATWDDGAALEAFVVRAAESPDAAEVQHAIEAALHKPQSSPAIPGAVVRFDQDSHFTGCEVRVGDRAGLLHALAVGIAAAGADVHAARVTTVAGFACDRFDLSDSAGRKLTPSMEEEIVRHITAGVAAPTRRRRPRTRFWRT